MNHEEFKKYQDKKKKAHYFVQLFEKCCAKCKFRIIKSHEGVDVTIFICEKLSPVVLHTNDNGLCDHYEPRED